MTSSMGGLGSVCKGDSMTKIDSIILISIDKNIHFGIKSKKQRLKLSMAVLLATYNTLTFRKEFPKALSAY